MGYSNSEPHALVVMTNSDVYYVTDHGAERLARSIENKEELFSFTDAKSGKRVRVQVSNVSSIVEGTQNA